MPLTRHCLAIPKAEANFKLNMLITRKSLHLNVNMWNNLPKDIVHAGSLTLFRNRLKIYMNIDWDDGKQFLIICI